MVGRSSRGRNRAFSKGEKAGADRAIAAHSGCDEIRHDPNADRRPRNSAGNCRQTRPALPNFYQRPAPSSTGAGKQDAIADTAPADKASSHQHVTLGKIPPMENHRSAGEKFQKLVETMARLRAP